MTDYNIVKLDSTINRTKQMEYKLFKDAITSGKMTASVSDLINRDLVNVNQLISYNGNRLTPLMIACLNKNTEIVIELLKNKNTDVNAKSADGTTALMLACQQFNGVKIDKDILIALSNKKGINETEKDNNGNNALIYAINNGDTSVIELLIEKFNGFSKENEIKYLYSKITPIADVVVSLFEKSGTDVNMKLDDGSTPLMHADSAETVKFLVEKGADVFAKKGDNTALQILKGDAKDALQKRINDILIKSVISVPKCDKIKELLEHGAEIDSTDGDGNTPLIHAVMKGDIDMVKCLLGNSADAKLENAVGNSAIIIASKLKIKDNKNYKVYEKIFKLLIPKLKFSEKYIDSVKRTVRNIVSKTGKGTRSLLFGKPKEGGKKRTRKNQPLK